MSSVRVVFVELDGTPEMVQQVISQFVDRTQAKPLVPALPAPVVDPPKPLAAPEPEAWPELPPELREPPAAKRKSPGRRAKKETPAFRFRPGTKPSAAVAGPAAESGTGKASPAQDVVRAVLAKGPMTSADLIIALEPDVKAGRIAVASIYALLSVMRKNGIVETRMSDGYRKNFLVE